ncbi:autophagy-related protein 18g-like [Curcuma longa]|uniref:autophagy-related protein 18g-like n=1 Tax=Curcuma longa TaxID=136217 RepID=UPI003D9F3099
MINLFPSFIKKKKKKLNPSMKKEDKFAEVRPFLIVSGEALVSLNGDNLDGDGSYFNELTTNQDMGTNTLSLAYLRFYSLRTHDYVHVQKFRTAIISVRCNSQVIVACQATQINCFNAATWVRSYTILAYPIGAACPSPSGLGYGPLAIGTRWLACSGKLVAASNTGCVSPQNMSPAKSMSLPHANGGLVLNFAKESSKQLTAGLVALGDMGYKKLSKYYYELLSDNGGLGRHGNSSLKDNGTTNEQYQSFRTFLVCLQNLQKDSMLKALIFIFIGCSVALPMQLYINFSDDSKWIVISASRGTSHLFALLLKKLQNFNQGNYICKQLAWIRFPD